MKETFQKHFLIGLCCQISISKCLILYNIIFLQINLQWLHKYRIILSSFDGHFLKILELANLYKCPITVLYCQNNFVQLIVVSAINNINIKCPTRWLRNVHSYWLVNGEIGFYLTQVLSKKCDHLPGIEIQNRVPSYQIWH